MQQNKNALSFALPPQGSTLFHDDVIRALNANPLTRHGWLGFGPGCRHERAAGRAGICTFQVAAIAAARDFGHDTAAALNMCVDADIMPTAARGKYDIVRCCH